MGSSDALFEYACLCWPRQPCTLLTVLWQAFLISCPLRRPGPFVVHPLYHQCKLWEACNKNLEGIVRFHHLFIWIRVRNNYTRLKKKKNLILWREGLSHPWCRQPWEQICSPQHGTCIPDAYEQTTHSLPPVSTTPKQLQSSVTKQIWGGGNGGLAMSL